MRKFIDDENTLTCIRFVPICIARVALSGTGVLEIVAAFVGTSRSSVSVAAATTWISGGVLIFVFFVLLFAMTGFCRLFGCVCVVFVFVFVFNVGQVFVFVGGSAIGFWAVGGIAFFCIFFFLLVVLFEMTGTFQSFGCVCIVFVFVFGVGQIFLYVFGLTIGGVVVVILSRFCCLFCCFSIASTITKRQSQTSRASFGDIASFIIP